jgi:hypothetical protein
LSVRIPTKGREKRREGGKRVERSLHFINHHHHPILTVLALRAIDPDRRRVVNHNRISGRCRRGARYWHETAVETLRAWGVHGDRLAGLREGGLRDGVVVGRELELHKVADVGFDVVGGVGKRPVGVADFHGVHDDLAGGGADRGGGGGGGCCCC